MSVLLRETAPAKVNLTLRVIGRRADGYHALESLVAFANLADQLTLEEGGDARLEAVGPFAEACGPSGDNLVLRAVRALGLRSGRFVLDKRIPVAAGLGGGSADAAAALRLVARLNGLSADDPRLVAAARATGADVPVCLEPRARIMRGAGEDLSPPLELPQLAALLVNPGVAVSTAQVFAAYAPGGSRSAALDDVPHSREAMLIWLGRHSNDLTGAATTCAPVIAEVLEALPVLPGCRVARMSGSGPTCFALFDSMDAASAAGKRLATMHENWWICPATLG